METAVLPLIEASDPSPPLRLLDQRGSWSKSRQKPAPGALQSSALCDEANPPGPVRVPKPARTPEEREGNANTSPEPYRKCRPSREVSANVQALSLSLSALCLPRVLASAVPRGCRPHPCKD